MLGRLHLNENLWVSDSPLYAELAAKCTTISYYPQMTYPESREALAHKLGVRPGQVILANGSSEIIHRLYLASANKAGSVLFPWPSYILYAELEQLSGYPATRCPLDNNHSINLLDLSNKIPSAAMILLCNPNNPTGSVFTRHKLEVFLSTTDHKTLVVVDEAYIEYSEDTKQYSALSLVNEWPQLVVVRTFSKYYGLAGLRLAYAVASEEKIRWLQGNLPNWNINCLADTALALCFRYDDYYQSRKDAMVVEREWLRVQLLTLGFQVASSVTNFLYVLHPLSLNIGYELQKHDIFVKFGPASGLPREALRITIGSRDDHEHLLYHVRTFLSSQTC